MRENKRVVESVGFSVGLEPSSRKGLGPVASGMSSVGTCFDLKLHDIPATVEAAVASAAALGARYLTIHAFGGPEMIERAVRRAERESPDLTLLVVTVLTSLSADDLASLSVGVGAPPEDQAVRLARMAAGAGASGFVCSPAELVAVRATVGPAAVIATPGIRPSGALANDQKRTGTPGEAIRNGATLLVVGRPIRDAPNPSAAARSVLAEITEALHGTPS